MFYLRNLPPGAVLQGDVLLSHLIPVKIAYTSSRGLAGTGVGAVIDSELTFSVRQQVSLISCLTARRRLGPRRSYAGMDHVNRSLAGLTYRRLYGRQVSGSLYDS